MFTVLVVLSFLGIVLLPLASIKLSRRTIALTEELIDLDIFVSTIRKCVLAGDLEKARKMAKVVESTTIGATTYSMLTAPEDSETINRCAEIGRVSARLCELKATRFDLAGWVRVIVIYGTPLLVMYGTDWSLLSIIPLSFAMLFCLLIELRVRLIKTAYREMIAKMPAAIEEVKRTLVEKR